MPGFDGLDTLLQEDLIDTSMIGVVQPEPTKVETTKTESKVEQKDAFPKHSTMEMFKEDNDLFDPEAKLVTEEVKKVEDVVDTTKVEDTKVEDTKVEEDTKANVYTTLSEFLKEEGILQFEGLDIKSAEDVKEAMIKQAEVIHEEWKEAQPPILKHLMDNWEEGVPLDQLINIKSNQIRYSGVTEDKLAENVDTQKAVYAEYLARTTKFSDAKITKEVQRLEDLDELKDAATEGLTELKALEAANEVELVKQTKVQKEVAKKEQEAYVAKIEDTIKNTKEIIPGIVLSEKEKKEVQKYMTSAVGVNAQGQPISKVQEIQAKDPIKFNMILNYFAAKGMFEGNFDKIQTKAKTDAVSKLEEAVAATSKKAATTGGTNNINTNEKTVSDLKASLARFAKK